MTGKVRTRWSLDREENEEYQVEVAAEDQGQYIYLAGRMSDWDKTLDLSV